MPFETTIDYLEDVKRPMFRRRDTITSSGQVSQHTCELQEISRQITEINTAIDILREKV